MKIGIPRERKKDETRVAILPEGVSELTKSGHNIIIEKGAGVKSGFSNEQFKKAGAKIADSLDQVWEQAELLVKVKEPAEEERKFFRPGLAVFSFIHPAAVPELTKDLVAKEVIGLDYDLLMLDDGRLPILEPMSIIAGKLSIQCGAQSLSAAAGGPGILLGGTPGVPPAKVVIVGAGASGSNAAKVAIGMGAEVTLLDIDSSKLAPFSDQPYKARTVYSNSETLEQEFSDADLIIGAVLIPGALAPKLLTKKMLSGLKKQSVIVDISIDQGGFAESSRATSISAPTYIEEGVIHSCVANIPALVPQTSTKALTRATFKWIKKLANNGIEESLKNFKPISRSLISYQGHFTNKVVAEAVGAETSQVKKIEQLLS